MVSLIICFIRYPKAERRQGYNMRPRSQGHRLPQSGCFEQHGGCSVLVRAPNFETSGAFQRQIDWFGTWKACYPAGLPKKQFFLWPKECACHILQAACCTTPFIDDQSLTWTITLKTVGDAGWFAGEHQSQLHELSSLRTRASLVGEW